MLSLGTTRAGTPHRPVATETQVYNGGRSLLYARDRIVLAITGNVYCRGMDGYAL